MINNCIVRAACNGCIELFNGYSLKPLTEAALSCQCACSCSCTISNADTKHDQNCAHVQHYPEECSIHRTAHSSFIGCQHHIQTSSSRSVHQCWVCDAPCQGQWQCHCQKLCTAAMSFLHPVRRITCSTASATSGTSSPY